MKQPRIPNPPNAVFGRTSPEAEARVLADQEAIKPIIEAVNAERKLREETAAKTLFGKKGKEEK